MYLSASVTYALDMVLQRYILARLLYIGNGEMGKQQRGSGKISHCSGAPGEEKHSMRDEITLQVITGCIKLPVGARLTNPCKIFYTFYGKRACQPRPYR